MAAVASVAGDATGRLEPVHLRHPDVHEEDVRAFAAREVDRLDAVRGFADDLDVGRRTQQHREPAAHEGLVVGDGDADHSGAP